MNTTRAALKIACLFWTALAVSGCISVGGSSSKNAPPPSVYTLHVPDPSNVKTAKSSDVILVSEPELPAGFNTERIALYFAQGHQIDYYADAAWSGRLDDVLRAFFVQAVRNDFGGRAIGTADISVPARYRLDIKVTDFQPVYAAGPDGVPRLDVAMTVSLALASNGKVISNVSVKKSAVATENRMSIVTKELETLLQQATDQAFHSLILHPAES